MIKQNKYKLIISAIITLLPMIFGIIVWDRLPENIATSFGWNGEITGYSSKMFAVVGLPVMLTFVNLICIIATSADPRRKNINNKVFSVVIGIVPVCSLLCGACIYANALGYKISVESIMPVFMGILFFVLGFILPKCKQNYTIGIKLPWTLHDEENWNKTHKFAGKLWVYGGIVMTVVGLFNLTFIFMTIIFALVIIPTVYSYLLYRKQK
ncbi:MAG: SdpI family protein [Clostridia bacterium]|nr:SdpI family protein [Clostridia bacterium]